MKTKIKEKQFDPVKFFRNEKEKIAKEISDMSFQELKEYLANRIKWVNKK